MTRALRIARLGAVAGCCLLAACGSSRQQQATVSPETQARLAEVAEQQGDKATALSMYQSAAERTPSDVVAQIRYADALARAGRIQQAQRALMQAMQTHPNRPELQRASALVDILGGTPSAALPKLDTLLAANPSDAAVLTDKGVALDLMGQHADAQQQYRKALSIMPNDVSIRNNLAMSLMLSGQPREAQTILEPAAQDDEAPTRVKVNMGILYAANGDVARAQQIVRNQLDQTALMLLAKRVNEGPASGASGAPINLTQPAR